MCRGEVVVVAGFADYLPQASAYLVRFPPKFQARFFDHVFLGTRHVAEFALQVTPCRLGLDPGGFGFLSDPTDFFSLSLQLLQNVFGLGTTRIHHRLGVFENVVWHAEVSRDVNCVASPRNSHEYLVSGQHGVGVKFDRGVGELVGFGGILGNRPVVRSYRDRHIVSGRMR